VLPGPKLPSSPSWGAALRNDAPGRLACRHGECTGGLPPPPPSRRPLRANVVAPTVPRRSPVARRCGAPAGAPMRRLRKWTQRVFVARVVGWNNLFHEWGYRMTSIPRCLGAESATDSVICSARYAPTGVPERAAGQTGRHDTYRRLRASTEPGAVQLATPTAVRGARLLAARCWSVPGLGRWQVPGAGGRGLARCRRASLG
jgi:hypothetical protein